MASEMIPYISGIPTDRNGKEGDAIDATEINRLVELAKQGSSDAFGELYSRLYPKLFGAARVALRTGAEDAVAETFARAWQALPRYRDRGVPFIAWLYGIQRHVIGDEFRRQQRIDKREIPDTASNDTGADERVDLARALLTLPKDQRQVIEMKYLLGMTNPEVAAAMKKSTGAVNAMQWRALRALEKEVRS